MSTLMKCGHTANAKDGDGRPVCVICAQIRPGWDEPAEFPTLEGRNMRCTYDQPGIGGGGKYHRHEDGDSVRPTDANAAFLELRPDDGWGERYFGSAWEPYDRYYCGCWGWD